tara:strand:+ start:165 stop:824 length:660 start_codon:yes stop_codon:yes gene_type:complete
VKKKIVFISTVAFILLANKIILSKLILFSLEKWINKDIIINDFNIIYKKRKVSLNNIIISDKDDSSKKIFQVEKIDIILKPSSLLSTLIIIEKVEIQKPILNLDFTISSDNKNLIKDNLGISKKFNKKESPKIYPKKLIDINFLVLDLSFENFKIDIKRSDTNNTSSIILSDMKLREFGNELGYQHYKDIFKIILIDLVMRIPDQELRKIIKKHYNFSQ